MEKKITEIFLILGGVALSAFAAVKLLSGGFVDLIWFLVCLVPFVLALFLGLKDWWPLLAIIIPGLPLPTATAVLLDKFTPSMVFNLALIAFFIGYICIRHKGVSLRTRFARPMLVVALAITARILMDPPGSGRVGGTGGLGNAVDYFLAGWCFFSLWWATVESSVSDRKLVKIILAVSIILFVWKGVTSDAGFVYELFHRRAWLMWPFVLGWLAYWQGLQRGRWLLFYILSLCIMGFGLLSPHRKTIVMAGLTCMAVAWVFRVEKKQIVILGISGLIGICVLFAMGRVPDMIKRPLSTILPQLAIETRAEAGYMGLYDEFRARNFELALKDVMHSPVIGRGFAWSTSDVVAIMARREREALESASESLSAVGMHHYGFISLMVAIGMIVPWFYAFSLCGIVWFFAKAGRNMPSGWSKVLVAGLTGYFINNLFQWLFNGSGSQMQTVTIALGIMVGLMQRWKIKAKQEENASLAGEFLPVSS